MGLIIGVGITVGVICGFLSAAIAQHKGFSGGPFFLLGFFLGVIGLVITAAARPAPPRFTPAGWYPDPWREAPSRWHDGTQWTPYTQAPQPLDH